MDRAKRHALGSLDPLEELDQASSPAEPRSLDFHRQGDSSVLAAFIAGY
jgi:hypothetical protein